jgi:predicted  nucleic acid-binding Zn-ribbon protein
MAEKIKSVAAYMKELRDAELSPMTMEEMHSHIRLRIRANKADAEQTRFAMTMLDMATTKEAAEKELEELRAEIPKARAKNELELTQMMANHQTQLAKQMREATENFQKEVEAERAKHKAGIEKLMAYTQSVSDELTGEIDSSKAALEQARAEKRKVEQEAGDIGRRITSLKLEYANTEKGLKAQLESLKLEEDKIRSNIAAMKKERDAFLKQFGSQV